LGEGDDDLHGGLHALLPASLHHLVPPFTGGIRQHLWIACIESRKESHVVGVIRHNEEIEGP
jgi:hypothetical protein